MLRWNQSINPLFTPYIASHENHRICVTYGLQNNFNETIVLPNMSTYYAISNCISRSPFIALSCKNKLNAELHDHDPRHLLRPLLPPTRDDHYNLCKRHHNLQLPAKTSTLSDNGFSKKMLYKNTGCERSTSIIHSQ